MPQAHQKSLPTGDFFISHCETSQFVHGMVEQSHSVYDLPRKAILIHVLLF